MNLFADDYQINQRPLNITWILNFFIPILHTGYKMVIIKKSHGEGNLSKKN